ncbi:hypothetical protein PFISCL1PPCAC_13725, partial [Pristionchus fissidentatus]
GTPPRSGSFPASPPCLGRNRAICEAQISVAPSILAHWSRLIRSYHLQTFQTSRPANSGPQSNRRLSQIVPETTETNCTNTYALAAHSTCTECKSFTATIGYGPNQ